MFFHLDKLHTTARQVVQESKDLPVGTAASSFIGALRSTLIIVRLSFKILVALLLIFLLCIVGWFLLTKLYHFLFLAIAMGYKEAEERLRKDLLAKLIHEDHSQYEVHSIEGQPIHETSVRVQGEKTIQSIDVKVFACGCPCIYEPGIVCDFCNKLSCSAHVYSCSVVGCGVLSCRRCATLIENQAYCAEHSFFRVALYYLKKLFRSKNEQTRSISSSPVSGRKWINLRSLAAAEDEKVSQYSEQDPRTESHRISKRPAS